MYLWKLIKIYNLKVLSLNKDLKMQSTKLKYFPCRKGNDHEGEVLNYICIEENCKEKGLICSICKLKHASHQTMPLKMLLQGLKDYKEKPLET